jgi:hypothetical protein
MTTLEDELDHLNAAIAAIECRFRALKLCAPAFVENDEASILVWKKYRDAWHLWVAPRNCGVTIARCIEAAEATNTLMRLSAMSIETRVTATSNLKKLYAALCEERQKQLNRVVEARTQVEQLLRMIPEGR